MQIFVVVETNPDGTWLHKGFSKENDAINYMSDTHAKLLRRFLDDSKRPADEQHFKGWSLAPLGTEDGTVFLWRDSINVKL